MSRTENPVRREARSESHRKPDIISLLAVHALDEKVGRCSLRRGKRRPKKRGIDEVGQRVVKKGVVEMSSSWVITRQV